jgi:hypothetical protein
LHAQVAEDLAAEISEQTGIWIEILATNEVWCKKSAIPTMQPVKLGQSPEELFQQYILEDESRNLVFLCVFTDPHEHDWGRLKPKDNEPR